MQATKQKLTPRQQHAKRLKLIAEVSGQWNPRFNFQESKSFVKTYRYYHNEGYPVDAAAQRAYDHYFVDRRSSL